MMGTSHGIMGAQTGVLLAVGTTPGLFTLPGVLVVLGCVAGSYFPDFDHAGGTLSRSLGPVTGLISMFFVNLSSVTYHATKARDDDMAGRSTKSFHHLSKRRHPTIRAGTHRHLTHTLVFAIVMGALAWPATGRWEIGLAFGVGCAVHDLGDMCTVQGVPFLWPLPLLKDQRWVEIHIVPKSLQVKTGDFGERVYVGVYVLSLAALLWWWPL